MSNYEIGYGKPPVSTRFEKGQSGNHKGHPKGARNKSSTEATKIYDIVLNAMASSVPITENGKTVKKSVVDAFIHSVSIQAIQGKTVGAMKLLWELVQFAEAE